MPSLNALTRLFSKPHLPVLRPIISRQADSSEFIIPSSYGSLDNSPAPGIVVAIVLGSVAGFLLLLFLLYTCLGFGIPITAITTTSHASRSVVSFRTASARRKHRRPVRATETYEVRTRERVPIVGDHDHGPPPIIIDGRRGPPPPRMVVPDDDEDDEIVVEEEHSPPPRRKSRRSSGRDDGRRRSSGFRDVDPDRYAGGDARVRSVSRRRYSRER